MDLVDPRGRAANTGTTFSAPPPESLHGRTVGLLHNGKRNGDRVLDALGDMLQGVHGVRGIVRAQKPSSSRPVAPDVADSLARQCDLVIAGVGD